MTVRRALLILYSDDFKKTIDGGHLTHNAPQFRNPDGSADTKNEMS